MLSLGPVDAHKEDRPIIETGQVEWPLKNQPNAKKSRINFFILELTFTRIDQYVGFFLEKRVSFRANDSTVTFTKVESLKRKKFCFSKKETSTFFQIFSFLSGIVRQGIVG